jgi:hypothetical protein
VEITQEIQRSDREVEKMYHLPWAFVPLQKPPQQNHYKSKKISSKEPRSRKDDNLHIYITRQRIEMKGGRAVGNQRWWW